MLEVLEIVSKVVLLLGLFYFAWSDYRTELIKVKGLLVFGVLGLFLQFGNFSLSQVLSGMLVGGMVLLLAWLSKENIGLGDGLLFIGTGVFLGFIENLALVLGSLFLAGIVSIACLVLKKKGRNDRMALGPFVLVAYVVFVI